MILIRLQCPDIVRIVSMVLTLIFNTYAYQLEDGLSQGGTCDLYASFMSSSSEVIRQYCYKCVGPDINDHVYLRKCVNRNCQHPKFDIIENGNLSYYECWSSCGGPPMACQPLVNFDHGGYICSEDLERDLTPRKFLVCQTCQAVCNHGYHLKQAVTNTCMRRNSTHIGWNNTEIIPSCISITQICGTPDIAGVTLKGCVTYSDFNTSTNQYSYYQECVVECQPGLYQVLTNVSASCGEDGVWSHRERMEKMCINPLLGCEMTKPPSGSWNCTGVWFNSTQISSGSRCHLNCVDLRSNGNALVCNNTHLSRLYRNLQKPFCYPGKGRRDIKEHRYDPNVALAVSGITLVLLLSIGICCRSQIWTHGRILRKKISECLSRVHRTRERDESLLLSGSSSSAEIMSQYSGSSVCGPTATQPVSVPLVQSAASQQQGSSAPQQQGSNMPPPEPQQQGSNMPPPEPQQQGSNILVPAPQQQGSNMPPPAPQQQGSNMPPPAPQQQGSNMPPPAPQQQGSNMLYSEPIPPSASMLPSAQGHPNVHEAADGMQDAHLSQLPPDFDFDSCLDEDMLRSGGKVSLEEAANGLDLPLHSLDSDESS